MVAYKLLTHTCMHAIHVEKDEKWTMCYTDIADIADDHEA
jgi:hypothetical protein